MQQVDSRAPVHIRTHTHINLNRSLLDHRITVNQVSKMNRRSSIFVVNIFLLGILLGMLSGADAGKEASIDAKLKGLLQDNNEIEKMFNLIDMSGSGKIEYSEFMMACIPQRVLLTNENMALVFKRFDDDGNGFISKE